MFGLAGQCKANWWYENNQVHILPDDKYIQEAIVLNADTGLIGMPQQTMGAGVNVRCLINPNIKLGGSSGWIRPQYIARLSAMTKSGSHQGY